MVHLNYNNLDASTQELLMFNSKQEVEQNIGAELKSYAKKHCLDYKQLLEEETIRNLYTNEYVFNI